MTQGSPNTSLANTFRGCALSTLLLSGAVLAQDAPAGLEKAVASATKWAAQADASQADAMWKASSPTMQKNVNQAGWSKYIGNLRQQFGAEQSRSWVGVGKVDNPQGMPVGEYLNVVYATRYAKGATFETVSMAKTSAGWQPVGYIVRPAETQASGSAATPPSAGK